MLVLFSSSPAMGQVLDETHASEEEREEALFGEEPEESGTDAEALALLHKERLQIGGFVYLRYSASFFENYLDEPTLSSPNLVDVYMDARPGDRVRGYVRGRLYYDPMAAGSTFLPGPVMDDVRALAEAAGESFPEMAATDVLLDQLWLKFDIARRIYVTLGKQPVYWGTTRLWNPVDVVNATRREPLTLFDERTGVSALKLHLPIESLAWNVIGLVLLDGADSFDKVGGALRLETVFSTVELSVSGMVRQERDASGENHVIPKLGVDFSAGIWELDVTGEAAAIFSRQTLRDPVLELGDREVSLQAAGGLSYTHKYSAEDFFVVGAEYFYNSEGSTDKLDYTALIPREDETGTDSPNGTDQSVAFSPFYHGRHYAALFFSLPGPGSWDYTSFTLSNLMSLSDKSGMTRFDYSVTVLTWMTVQAYAMANWGERGGVFRFGFAAPPLIPEFYQAFTAGVNLRIDI